MGQYYTEEGQSYTESTPEELASIKNLLYSLRSASEVSIGDIDKHKNAILYLTSTETILQRDLGLQINALVGRSNDESETKDLLLGLRKRYNKIYMGNSHWSRTASVLKSMTSGFFPFLEDVFKGKEKTADLLQILDMLVDYVMGLGVAASNFNKSFISSMVKNSEYTKKEFLQLRNLATTSIKVGLEHGISADETQSIFEALTSTGDKLSSLFSSMGSEFNNISQYEALVTLSHFLPQSVQELATTKGEISQKLGVQSEGVVKSLYSFYDVFKNKDILIPDVYSTMIAEAQEFTAFGSSLDDTILGLQRSIYATGASKTGIDFFKKFRLSKGDGGRSLGYILIEKGLEGFTEKSIKNRKLLLKSIQDRIGTLKNKKIKGKKTLIYENLLRLQKEVKFSDMVGSFSPEGREFIYNYLTSSGAELGRSLLKDFIVNSNPTKDTLLGTRIAEAYGLDLLYGQIINYGENLKSTDDPSSDDPSSDEGVKDTIANMVLKSKELGLLQVGVLEHLSSTLKAFMLKGSFQYGLDALIGFLDWTLFLRNTSFYKKNISMSKDFDNSLDVMLKDVRQILSAKSKMMLKFVKKESTPKSAQEIKDKALLKVPYEELSMVEPSMVDPLSTLVQPKPFSMKTNKKENQAAPFDKLSKHLDQESLTDLGLSSLNILALDKDELKIITQKISFDFKGDVDKEVQTLVGDYG